MPLMYARVCCLLVVLMLVVLLGCSATVSSDNVPGSYVASYSFGTATLTLHRDGTFSQRVAVNGQPPATVQGSWSFDQASSRLALHGAMAPADDVCALNKDWRKPRDFRGIPVERLWLRIEIQSPENCAYVKQ